MAIRNPQALKALLTPGKRLIGLDLGEKTIGVAISDPGLTIASPIDTIRRTKFTEDVKQLVRMIAGREVGGIVIGLPINMDGTEGPRCQSVRHFGQNLLARADLLGMQPEIAFWDERMSTVAIQRLLVSEADMSRGKRAQAVDKMAAAYILQGALDALAKGAPQT
ncbi:MAG TPA: Holliday junction resolvase RuvX [Alphaproteobacteria bacterium]|jgi:putative Holliday junction resolvase|nr:Holliday junction resolvase RuvX [Alphaproteobacteria bacterium]